METPATSQTNGVKISLVSRKRLEPMASAEKIRFILDEIESGKILILEWGLTPQEEAQLIAATMADIDQDQFTGIEMQSYGLDESGRWTKLLNLYRKKRPRMVVIGPAATLRTVSKDDHSIEALIVPAAGVPVPGA